MKYGYDPKYKDRGIMPPFSPEKELGMCKSKSDCCL